MVWLRGIASKPEIHPISKRGPHFSQTQRRVCPPFCILTRSINYFIEYVVNGTGIPGVNFDVGESYAGLMPITTNPNGTDKFYFWFFPTTNTDPAAQEEILIWLNGGPGKMNLYSPLMKSNGLTGVYFRLFFPLGVSR
jgi:hypothetical protein